VKFDIANNEKSGDDFHLIFCWN